MMNFSKSFTAALICSLYLFIFSAEANPFSENKFLIQEDTARYKKNRTYNLQTGLYGVYKTKSASVVMLGNSITQGVNWNELLSRNDVVNRGISGDITEGFLSRMEYIYKLQPKLCFVMGGINDLWQDIPVETVFLNYVKILEGLKVHGITPIIQSTLFTNSAWKRSDEKNPEVEKLNLHLLKYAEENDIEYLDLNAKLSKNKLLIEDYSYDGLHLNWKGYEVWGKEVEGIIRNKGL